jgi:DNA polymerase-1
MLGRKRRLPELMHSDQYKRWRAERQAFNTLIQGSAADVAKLAMVDLYKNLDSDMHILLTVHDEFVVSTPDDKAEKARRIVTDTMQNVGERLGLAVPLKVDAKLCTRWSDGK